jgi:hypothetical protein
VPFHVYFHMISGQRKRKAASALHWNICIMFELHGKLQKLEKKTRCSLEATISNFIILEMKTSEREVTPSLFR